MTKAERAKLKKCRIPQTQYVEYAGIPCVTWMLIKLYHPLKEVEAFDEWFTGQTGMIGDDGTLLIYAHDYERWLAGRERNV